MSSSQKIQYALLSLSGKSIRTLTLLAGEVRDAIQCSLQVVDLDERPAYDALSYTWGEAGITDMIKVDGIEVQVTINLERALR